MNILKKLTLFVIVALVGSGVSLDAMQVQSIKQVTGQPTGLPIHKKQSQSDRKAKGRMKKNPMSPAHGYSGTNKAFIF